MFMYMTSASLLTGGFSSLILLPDSEMARNRVKREEDDDEEEDVTSHLQTHSTFDIQVKNHYFWIQRSLKQLKN